MTVTVYRSTDAGAPSLNGVQGTLINVLNSCLVTGYGSKPAAGWSQPFSGVNVAVFKQPLTSNQRYIRVDETAADTYARFQAYENMTDVSTGTGPFPHPYLYGNNILKSTFGVGNTTPVGWMITATDKIFHLWICANIPAQQMSYSYGMSFGDIVSTSSVDTYNTLLMAPNTSYNTSTGGASIMQLLKHTNSIAPQNYYGMSMARNYTQVGDSIQVYKYTDNHRCHRSDGDFFSGNGTNAAPFIDPIDNKIHIAPMYVAENVGTTNFIQRGTIPGLWVPCFAAVGNLIDGDILTDVADLPGRTFEAKWLGDGSRGTSFVLFEISDTW